MSDKKQQFKKNLSIESLHLQYHRYADYLMRKLNNKSSSDNQNLTNKDFKFSRKILKVIKLESSRDKVHLQSANDRNKR